MARFFLNNTSSWNDTANWSASDGGIGGSSVPNIGDAVFLTALSGDCDIDVNAFAQKIDDTGYTNTLTQTLAFTLEVGTNNLLWSSGTFVGGTEKIIVGSDFIQSGGVFTNTSGIMEFNQNSNSFMTRTAGTYNHNNGTIETTGNHFDLDLNGAESFNLHSNFSNSATIWQFLSQTVIRRDMIADKGAFTTDNITIDLHGDYKVSPQQGNTATVLFNMVGTGDQSVYFDKAGGVGLSGAGIICNKPSGTLTFYDDLLFKIGVGGTVLKYVQGDVAFDETSIIVDGGFSSITDWEGGPRIPHYDFNKLNATTATTLDSRLDVIDLTNNGVGNVNGSSLNITGNINSDNSLTGTSEIDLTGSANQMITAIDQFGGTVLNVKKSGGVVIQQNSISGSFDIDVQTGSWCTSGNDLTVDNLNIDAPAKFTRVTGDTVTAAVTGTITDASSCGLYSAKFFLAFKQFIGDN